MVRLLTGSGSILGFLEGHTEYVHAPTFSQDGRRILTTSNDQTARVWTAAGHQLLAVLRGRNADIMSAVFSLDGQRIVTTSLEETVRVYHVVTLSDVAQLLEE